jgi:predicted transcriptional regulator
MSDISAQTGLPVSTLITQAVKEFLTAQECKGFPSGRSNQAAYRFLNHQKITKVIGEY